jgi:hypothetical protein
MFLCWRLNYTLFSLLAVYLRKILPQNLLLTEQDLTRYAEERGLNIGPEDLEYFEELGLLPPLCRLKLPIVEERQLDGEVRRRYAALCDISHELKNWCETGLCEDPIKTKFRPWKEYRDGYQETARALYHPWQFMNLGTILHWIGHRLTVPQIFDEERLKRIRENMKKFWGSQKDWVDFVTKRVNRDLRFLPFLISIEDVYLPPIRSNFIGILGASDSGFEIWRSLRSNFDPKKALSEFDLTVEQIENWRTQIAAETRSRDPLRNWYLLVRHVSYHKRQKLTGGALFAQDCYEIIEVLGRFLEDLTGKPQYGPDDLFDGRRGEWKKDFYGGEVDFANRDVLRRIVYEYGLDYDCKVLLFLEGDTEVNAVPIIADAMGISFARFGVRPEKLGGYCEIHPKRMEKLLKYAKSNGIMVYIIIDNHEHSREYVEELLIRKDLPVERDRVRIWNVDFEADNFLIDELIEAAAQAASKDGVSPRITPEMVEKKRELLPKAGIGDMIVAMCEEQTYTLSKAELGKQLGLMIAERIKKGEVNTTKIEEELWRVAKLVMG